MADKRVQFDTETVDSGNHRLKRSPVGLRIARTCVRCGNSFTVRPCKVKRGAKYCSESCKFNRPGYVRRTSIIERDGEIFKICLDCKKEFPIETFAKSKGAGGRHSVCPDCERRRRRESARKNNIEVNARNRNRERLIKLAVIAGYGGRCVCCEESEPYFLTIDHIFNDGAKERFPDGRQQPRRASNLYRVLIQKGFPRDRYQLLCFNCNCAKGFFGICPHQAKRLLEASACLPESVSTEILNGELRLKIA